MIYTDLSFTLGNNQRVEEYVNSLPIENDMKEKLYNDLLKQNFRNEKVNIN